MPDAQQKCPCNCCLARELSAQLGRSVDTWELLYGINSAPAAYLREHPKATLQELDRIARESR